MNKGIAIIALSAVLCACGSGKQGESKYVLAVGVEIHTKKGGKVIGTEEETDTVSAATPLAAYTKGIQKYAAVLMHIQQFPDSVAGATGLEVRDEQGDNIVPSIPQEQRDSVIMHFIQFARRSDIPYYDRVKDFELKLMKAR